MSVAPVGALGTVESSCVISVADDPVEAWPLLSRLRNRVDSKLITFLMWCPVNQPDLSKLLNIVPCYPRLPCQLFP